MKKSWEKNWGRLPDEAKLGSGGQGIVYKANRVTDGMAAALKVYHPKRSGEASVVSEQRLRRSAHEVSVLRILGGRGVPLVYESNVESPEEGERHFAAFEFIDGVDLQNWVTAHDRIPLEMVVRFARSLAKPLRELHALGLAHRDLKPRNIMLRHADPEQAVLLDFGLVGGSGFADRSTRTGEQLTNEFLILPELLQGAPGQAASDTALFAGLLLFALTGKTPTHLRDTNGQTPAKHLTARSFESERQAQAMQQFFLRAFQWSPQARFQTIDTLMHALESAAGAEPHPPPGETALSEEVTAYIHSDERSRLITEIAGVQAQLQRALFEHDYLQRHFPLTPHVAAHVRLILDTQPSALRGRELWLDYCAEVYLPGRRPGSSTCLFVLRPESNGCLSVAFRSAGDRNATRVEDEVELLPPITADVAGVTLVLERVFEECRRSEPEILRRAFEKAKTAALL